MNKKIKYIDIKEFVEKGYLQEVNRCFFHPLGLALSVYIDGDEYKIEGILDYREDEEGVIFDLKNSNIERIEEFKKKEIFIANQFLKYALKRREMFLGENVEPIFFNKKSKNI